MAIAPVEANRPLLSSNEVVDYVRTALAHLYAYAFLRNHPLTILLEGRSGSYELTRAQRMRRLLLDFLERLRKFVKQQRLSEDVFPELHE